MKTTGEEKRGEERRKHEMKGGTGKHWEMIGDKCKLKEQKRGEELKKDRMKWKE